MKINIIGCAPEWQNAPTDGICWGINCHILKRPFNVVFDMHDVAYEFTGVHTEPWKLPQIPRLPVLSEHSDTTVFTLGGVEYTNYIPYPLEKICTHFNNDYFSSGACYAIALAIYQGATEIDLWGFYLSSSNEWAYQKPCMEYWIGRAEGMGIKVEVHGMTRLLKNLRDNIYGYNYKQKVRL